MRNKVVQLVFCILALVLGGAAEEILPKFLGVGFPVLLMLVQILSPLLTASEAVLFAIAAGGCEDAISCLPPFLSASYFLAVAFLIRWVEFPLAAILLTYPLYHLWLRVWVSNLQSSIFVRLAVSLPLGLLTALAVGLLVHWTRRKAAIDETD